LLARLVWAAHAPFPQHFWMDERFSAAAITQPVPRLLLFCRKDVHPPLYYLILKGWNALTPQAHRAAPERLTDYHLQRIGGDAWFTSVARDGTTRQIPGLYPDDWARWPLGPLWFLRLPSIVFALLSAFFTYLMAKRLWPPQAGIAWVGMLLCLFSPFMLTWDTVMRSYALQGMLLAAMTLLVVRGNQNKWQLFAIVILAAMMLLTGYLLLLAFPFLLLAHYLMHRSAHHSAVFVGSFAAGVLVFAALWGRSFMAQGALRQADVASASWLARLAYECGRMAQAHWKMLFSYGDVANLNPDSSLMLYLPAFGLYAACIGRFFYEVLKRWVAADSAILAMAFGPTVLTVIANTLKPGTLPVWPRYFYPFAPFFFLLLARGGFLLLRRD